MAVKRKIKRSHNPVLRKLWYSQILNKFNVLQSQEVYDKILKEYNNFNTEFLVSVPPDDVQRSGLWKFWPLTEELNNFNLGGKSVNCIDFFQYTYNTIKQIDPENIINMGFSVLQPGCELNAHTGYHNNMPHNCVFRLHLPINVPELSIETLGLSIYEDNDEPGYGPPVTEPTRMIQWKERELIVFDDSYKHKAWNYCSKPRVNILIDYLHKTRHSDMYTARSPLTEQIEPVDKVARDFFSFLWSEINRLNYVQDSIDDVQEV